MSAWRVEARHIIGARHITSHYDVSRDGRPYLRLPAGDDLRELIVAVLAAVPGEDREAILKEVKPEKWA